MDDRLNAQSTRTWRRQIAFTLIVAALIFAPAGALAYWRVRSRLIALIW